MSKYISLENLERYDAKMQERIASFCASKADGMWRQTEKAGAVQFWPVGNSPLEGTVEFMFKETPPASGEKGPNNPSTITGVTGINLVRCSKNFYVYSGDKVQNGITFTDNGDGSITANGTATGVATYRLSINPNASFWLKSGIPYYISGCPSGGSSNKYYITQYGGVGRDIGNGSAVLLDENTASAADIVIYTGYTASNLTFWPQLELGTSATSFERGVTDNYTINLGGTYYGGSIDLATGLMTVTFEATAITGTETWYLDGSSTNDVSVFRCDLRPGGTFSNGVNSGNRACSHFPLRTNFAVNTFTTWASSNARVYFRLPSSSYPDVDTFKNWLVSEYASNHPVTVVYKLNNPYTLQLTPPQIRALSQPDKYVPRINIVYTDAENVQIVYQKNPVRDKFEKVQAIIAQGGNV